MNAVEHNAYPTGRWSDASAAIETMIAPLPPAAPIVLTAIEAMDLQFCEERIERGLETFLEVGVALTLIRDKRLYRATHQTFDAYCIERWEIKASRARQLCAAAEVLHNLGLGKMEADASIGLPGNERQVRPLMALPPEQQREAWAEAVTTAPNGKVTSAHVAEAVRKITGKPAPTKKATEFKIVDAGSRSERLRAAADRAIAGVRELLDLQGTPDSEAASEVAVSLSKLETYVVHLGRLHGKVGGRS